MRNVADGIIERAQAWGVERIFGYAGDGVDPLLGALRRREGEIELITARHEEMAAFMATGHAKYTGEVGVCLATQGPGGVHLLTGLYDAKLDGKPVVAIVGHVVTTALGSGYQQEVELPTLLKDVCSSYVGELVSPNSSTRWWTMPSAPRSPPLAPPASSSRTTSSRRSCRTSSTPMASCPAPRSPPCPGSSLARTIWDRAAEVLNAGQRIALLVG
ncbi:thiamine pyrophosphate-binding protein [Brachybacterium sp. Z12]|uniref:thiamine pyrophosphate-binding protein n=1 Tax=Brachybacterium sp. Z12 TaxID=2759167 RepID=UPI00223A89F6|nr:thiamine pyrophosphate-binding protein [Brachybacterium sp. Z12]